MTSARAALSVGSRRTNGFPRTRFLRSIVDGDLAALGLAGGACALVSEADSERQRPRLSLRRMRGHGARGDDRDAHTGAPGPSAARSQADSDRLAEAAAPPDARAAVGSIVDARK